MKYLYVSVVQFSTVMNPTLSLSGKKKLLSLSSAQICLNKWIKMKTVAWLQLLLKSYLYLCILHNLVVLNVVNSVLNALSSVLKAAGDGEGTREICRDNRLYQIISNYLGMTLHFCLTFPSLGTTCIISLSFSQNIKSLTITL